MTTKHPPEPGTTVGLIDVPLATTARYVRWHFKRHHWLMIDEVEVYGK